MRRTPLRRRPRYNRARERWVRQFHSPAFVEFVSLLPCERCGRVDVMGNEVSHVPTRGAGGTWLDAHSLCADCHRLGPRALHVVGVETFFGRLGKDPREVNARVHRLWLERSDMAS